MTDKRLDSVDDRRQLQRDNHPDDDAYQATKQTRQQAVPDKNGTDQPIFRPEGS